MSFSFNNTGSTDGYSGMDSFEVNLNQNFQSNAPGTATTFQIHNNSQSVMTPQTPAKRRRGRPSKTIESTDGNPSPAATSSAAVLKQGSPKASVCLMRVSPLRKLSVGSSSPSQVNPSPKGGQLMVLDNKKTSSPSNGKKGRKASASASAKKKLNFYETSKIHDTIHNLTNTGEFASPASSHITPVLARHDSLVNPSLLLSSPIESEQGLSRSIKPKESKVEPTTDINSNSKSNIGTVDNFFISSSPKSPHPSSCFSSILQSSPLYNGYFANFPSSPAVGLPSSNNTSAKTTPHKAETKPMFNFQKKIEQLENPKNPSNSPNIPPTQFKVIKSTPIKKQSELKTKSKSKSKSMPNLGAFKFSLSINEDGQAVLLKTATVPPLSNPKINKDTLIPITESPNHETIANTSSSSSTTITTVPETPKSSNHATSMFSPTFHLTTPNRIDASFAMEPSRFIFPDLAATPNAPSSFAFSDGSISLSFTPNPHGHSSNFHNDMLLYSGHVVEDSNLPSFGSSHSQQKKNISNDKSENSSNFSDFEAIMNDESMKFDARKALFNLVKNKGASCA